MATLNNQMVYIYIYIYYALDLVGDGLQKKIHSLEDDLSQYERIINPLFIVFHRNPNSHQLVQDGFSIHSIPIWSPYS